MSELCVCSRSCVFAVRAVCFRAVCLQSELCVCVCLQSEPCVSVGAVCLQSELCVCVFPVGAVFFSRVCLQSELCVCSRSCVCVCSRSCVFSAVCVCSRSCVCVCSRSCVLHPCLLPRSLHQACPLTDHTHIHTSTAGPRLRPEL